MTGSSGKRPVSEREQQLWKTITANVKPLFKNGKSGSGKTKPKQKASQAESQSSFPSKKPSIKSLSPPLDKEKVFCERGTSKTAGIDRRTTNRLRRGQLPIEGELDLHGFKQTQARQALDSFIEKAAHERKRCLLVITGKGERAGVAKGWRGSGVLREAVPNWLNDPVNRDLILTFCHAQPRDGGNGALYVLLKRKRGG